MTSEDIKHQVIIILIFPIRQKDVRGRPAHPIVRECSGDRLVRSVPEEVLAGTEISGGGERGILYLTLHCHHQDSCVKIGSNVSRFDVSLFVRGKSQRQCP